MTIDEIKQALREIKEYCKNRETCEDCSFAISQGRDEVCPMIGHIGDIPYPSGWNLGWPEAAPIGKANATASLTLNDYQRMARRTAGNKKKSDKMEEALFGLAGEVGELCDHYKKYMHQGHDLDYDHMAEEAGDGCGIWRRSPTRWGSPWRISPGGTSTSCATATRTASTRSAACTGRESMKVTIEIPDGPRCMDHNLKHCKLCAYAAHLQAYNCRLYGRLLKGGEIPVKCPECEEGANGKE